MCEVLHIIQEDSYGDLTTQLNTFFVFSARSGYVCSYVLCLSYVMSYAGGRLGHRSSAVSPLNWNHDFLVYVPALF